MRASMAPIFLLSISETLILQSVVRVLPFRKRPSETHSGPGLETPTDAVTFVRLQHQVRSRPVWRASQRSDPSTTSTIPFTLHKGSCVKSLSSRSPVSCLLPNSFRRSETKPSADNACSKGTPALHTTRAHKDCLALCLQQRRADHSPRQADKVRCIGNVHQVCRQPLDLQMYMHLGVRNKLLGW